MSRARDLADGTFSGAFSADSPTLVVDATNNKVGIGTTAPNNYYAKDLVIAAPDEGGVTVVSDPTHSAYLLFADGTSGADQYRGQIFYDHNVDRLGIAANGSTRLLIDSDGLKFNGDTAAANALDDFETGSWSPSVSNGSFQNVLDAHYIKIGNQVTVWLYAQSISDITTASNFEISNLPFTSSTDVDSVTGTVMLRYLNRSSSEQTNLISYMAQNGTTLRIYAVINNANYVVVRNSDFINGNIGLRITLTYIAA